MGFRHTSESNRGEFGICRAGERPGALAENVNVSMRTPECGIGGGRAVADATTRKETAGLKPRTALGHSVGATATARKNIATRIALFVLRCYKIYLSMLFAGTCRFEPTCSQYAYEAIERFGVLRGVWLGSKRLARCHPFSGQFGFDPVPEKLSSNHFCGVA